MEAEAGGLLCNRPGSSSGRSNGSVGTAVAVDFGVIAGADVRHEVAGLSPEGEHAAIDQNEDADLRTPTEIGQAAVAFEKRVRAVVGIDHDHRLASELVRAGAARCDEIADLDPKVDERIGLFSAQRLEVVDILWRDLGILPFERRASELDPFADKVGEIDLSNPGFCSWSSGFGEFSKQFIELRHF